MSLDDRYGAPSAVRGVALRVVVVVLVVAFGAWLTWVVLSQSRPQVASDNLTFEQGAPGRMIASFDVELRDPGVEALCTVKAYAEDHTLVGTQSFTPEPDESGRVEIEIVTEREATSVELVGCTAPGQSRPQ